MDRFCEDITVALYLVNDGQAATVHSYSRRPPSPPVSPWLAEAMVTCSPACDRPAMTVGPSEFSCGSWHELAARRAFLEANKVDPPLRPRGPAAGDERRADRPVHHGPAARRGCVPGRAPWRRTRRRQSAPRPSRQASPSSPASTTDADDPTHRSDFACGAPHDELVGLLLARAINVRAALRETRAGGRSRGARRPERAGAAAPS